MNQYRLSFFLSAVLLLIHNNVEMELSLQKLAVSGEKQMADMKRWDKLDFQSVQNPVAQTVHHSDC